MKAIIKKTLQRTTLLTAIVASAFVNGEVISSTVDMNEVSHIKIGGPFNVVVTQGEPEFVRVITDEKNLDKLEVKVSGGVLRIDRKHLSGLWNIGNDIQAEFEVQLKDIKSIENRDSGSLNVMPITSNGRLIIESRGSGDIKVASLKIRKVEFSSRGSGELQIESVEADDVEINTRGSGDFSLDQLKAEELDISVYGSSDLNIGGENGGGVDEVDISVRGSGDVNVEKIVAQYADVSVYGSGDVRVNAAQRLEVDIRGSGDVRYRGNPAELEQKVNGSGDVRSIK